MEKSSTPACQGFCGRAKPLRPAGVGVVLLSGEVRIRVDASLQPSIQSIQERGKWNSGHAVEGKREAGGSNCGLGVEVWEANLNDRGGEEAERWEAKSGRVFVEGREDRECIRGCGGYAEEEGSAEGGGSVQEVGFADEQPNTYESERNKHVAYVRERLQLLLSAKSSMWVPYIFGFLLLLGYGCFHFSFARTRTI